MEILAFVIFLVSYLVALAGIVLPALPGVPIAAGGAVIAAWITGFVTLGTWPLFLVVALALLSVVLDYLAGVMGAKRYGASRAGVWGSIIGGLIGLFFPPLGFLFGALLGAVAFELLNARTLPDALRAGFGVFVGTLGGILARVVILITMGIIVFPRLL
jgi:uncharacterized protein YqgC (DUF456 family)